MKWFRRQLDRLRGRKANAPVYDGPTWYASEESSPFAVPNAFYYVVRGRNLPPNQIADVAGLVASLMRKVKPLEWTRLYREFKGIDVLPQEVDDLARFAQDVAVELLGVATLNGNGFVRQAALTKLASISHPRILPYVILRLGDWVPQVRQEAEKALADALSRGYASTLLDYGYLVDWLERVERVNLSGFRDRILARLRAPENRAELLSRLDEGEQSTRMFCLRIIEDELPSRPDLVEKILTDPSPTLRQWMIPHALKAERHLAGAWLQRLLADPSARVRTVAIRQVPDDLWPSVRDRIAEQISANSSSLRGAARFYLRLHGEEDFAARYRTLLASGRVTPGVIAGLGETGGPEDYDLLAPYVSSVKPTIRAAMVIAIVRLDRARASGTAVKALDDPSARVRRAAVMALSEDRSAEVIEGERSVLHGGSVRGQLAAFRLLSQRGGWEAVVDILAAVAKNRPDVSAVAWPELLSWYWRQCHRGWIRPNQEARRQIRGVLKELQQMQVAPPQDLQQAWNEIVTAAQEEGKP